MVTTMVKTKVPISDETSYGTEQTDDYRQLNVNYNQRQIITLTSNEVAWLFGTDVETVEEWVGYRILTPCGIAPNGSKIFWREHIAGLLAMHGA